MKKVNVELEIPENMEVGEIFQLISTNINVQLKPRTPRKLIFEEIIGQTAVNPGEYWTPQRNESNVPYVLYEGEAAWKLIEE